MTAGGIFPALVGTIWLVAVALLVSVPVGVAAAHLPQRVRAGQLAHAHHQPGDHQPGRRAVDRARAVRRRRLRALLRLRHQHPGGQPDAGDHDPAGGHRRHARVAAGGAAGLPRGLLEHGRHALADDPPASCCRTRSAASSPASSSRCRAPPARRRRSCSPARPSSCRSCPQSVFDQTMAMSLHLFVISTQVPGRARGAALRRGAGADRHGAGR